ncbi:triose-phosphate isomerase [Kordiimonas sp. SCSIO 12603]|uniref:triose-phosphate isomerase n=1 Tax=Kordiimonas sp. SCSIO 12603 TaxID=2829596 RepID=UPI002102C7EF|nr:triose-phosphate isomerase [Kordiimonas sp. SCSIO 12603]UTW57463.1 triose-phosphate isomerase [Kordiimonas sp. SCSIO 12603]
MTTPTPLVAGNWKMNGLSSSLAELEALETFVKEQAEASCELLICPPFTLVAAMAVKAGGSVKIGAQDCHFNKSGAHTGDISAEMLKDIGAEYIIVGHSERRADHEETSDTVNAKAAAIHGEGLSAIVCVGETEEERDAGQTETVVLGQLLVSVPDSATPTNTVIAYEPVWAIGTGKTPTVADVAEIHTAIRGALVERFGEAGKEFRILYGGSVKPSNADELMAADNVNGALVGGASLKASDFNGIIDAYRS